jgi:hypothetical protein
LAAAGLPVRKDSKTNHFTPNLSKKLFLNLPPFLRMLCPLLAPRCGEDVKLFEPFRTDFNN